MSEGNVRIKLNGDQAIVLFEWLSRFNKQKKQNFEDQAEQRVLWDMEAQLEAHLVAPFRVEYPAILEKARARVRDQE